VGEITSRVDAYWSAVFGVTPADLHAPGVRVSPHQGERVGWRAVYALVLGDAASVLAPASMCTPLSAVLAGHAAVDVLDSAAWHGLLRGDVSAVLGPSVHLYLTDRSALAGIAQGRRLNPGDTAALARLRATVAAEEWEHAGFGAQAVSLFGLFDGDSLLAAANLTAGPGGASDVGVLTRPDVRGNGYGERVAAVAATQAVAMCGIARYRVVTTYPGSLGIARRLGFAEYGRNLIVLLT
jgi:hypothetical protein